MDEGKLVNRDALIGPGAWHSVGTALFGLVLAALGFGESFGLLMIATSLPGALTTIVLFLAILGTPLVVRRRCRAARVIQASLATILLAPMFYGPCSALVPVWLWRFGLVPDEPPSLAVALLSSGLYFLLFLGFLTCVHGLTSWPWGCSHVKQAA